MVGMKSNPLEPLSVFTKLSPELKRYLAAIALTALALGFSNDVISNYFKDAYHVTPYQRGLIEFPRELPGILCTFIVIALSSLGDLRVSIIAQALSLIGISVLGLSSPPFTVMLAFLFINSLGMHLFMPLQDSIGMKLAGKEKLGTMVGTFKGVSTAFAMVAAIAVFFGFRFGLFSFNRRIKWIFIASAALLAAVLIIFISLDRRMRGERGQRKKTRFVFRKEYGFYYLLVIMFGVQKQIMMVYGPWVIIDLLGKKADTLALLGISGSFLGVFFIPALGRMLDRFGIKAMLYADALSFIGVYLLYGLVAGGYASGALPTVGVAVFLAYAIFVVDRMSTQMGFIRTVYLRTIAVDPADVTPTLSLGMSMDHVVSIACAYAGGIVWTLWGPQYVFYLAAALSLVNLFVAIRVKPPAALS
jgi:predicted MFS family arabinose efflux permease